MTASIRMAEAADEETDAPAIVEACSRWTAATVEFF